MSQYSGYSTAYGAYPPPRKRGGVVYSQWTRQEFEVPRFFNNLLASLVLLLWPFLFLMVLINPQLEESYLYVAIGVYVLATLVLFVGHYRRNIFLCILGYGLLAAASGFVYWSFSAGARQTISP